MIILLVTAPLVLREEFAPPGLSSFSYRTANHLISAWFHVEHFPIAGFGCVFYVLFLIVLLHFLNLIVFILWLYIEDRVDIKN